MAQTETLATIDAMEAEYQQETYRFLLDVRADARTYRPEEIADEEGNPSIDVRLQISADGSYGFHSGDSSYDCDHRGFWGSGSVAPDSGECELIDLARDMVSQAIDDAYQCEA